MMSPANLRMSNIITQGKNFLPFSLLKKSCGQVFLFIFWGAWPGLDNYHIFEGSEMKGKINVLLSFLRMDESMVSGGCCLY